METPQGCRWQSLSRLPQWRSRGRNTGPWRWRVSLLWGCPTGGWRSSVWPSILSVSAVTLLPWRFLVSVGQSGYDYRFCTSQFTVAWRVSRKPDLIFMVSWSLCGCYKTAWFYFFILCSPTCCKAIYSISANRIQNPQKENININLSLIVQTSSSLPPWLERQAFWPSSLCYLFFCFTNISRYGVPLKLHSLKHTVV